MSLLIIKLSVVRQIKKVGIQEYNHHIYKGRNLPIGR